jgi:predicted nucleic acid-binding protein
MNAVDTNVFLYSLDVNEPAKQAKAKALLARLVGAPVGTVTLWQVAGELLNGLRRWQNAGKVAAPDVPANFHDLLALFPLVAPTPAAFPTYFDLFSRFSLSHWDAMLLAACHEAGVTTLYSEDMDAGTDYDGLKIVNPFA